MSVKTISKVVPDVKEPQPGSAAQGPTSPAPAILHPIVKQPLLAFHFRFYGFIIFIFENGICQAGCSLRSDGRLGILR